MSNGQPITHTELTTIPDSVQEILGGYHKFQEHWPQRKHFFLREVPTPEVESRLFYWDAFLRLMGA